MLQCNRYPSSAGINQDWWLDGRYERQFPNSETGTRENTKLQKQVDSLITENNNLQQERYELQRLQELYQLDKNYADYKKLLRM